VRFQEAECQLLLYSCSNTVFKGIPIEPRYAMTTSYRSATYASTFRSNTTTHPMIPKGTNTGTVAQNRAYLPTHQFQALLEQDTLEAHTCRRSDN
jgi:hypothetical protein